MTQSQNSSTATAVLYGLPFLAHAILLTPLITFIPAFYAEDFGLPFATVGLVLFFSRLSLVFVEPLVGFLSDRTRTRFGRRKPWIVAGLPLLMLATFMVFAPPGEGDGALRHILDHPHPDCAHPGRHAL